MFFVTTTYLGVLETTSPCRVGGWVLRWPALGAYCEALLLSTYCFWLSLAWLARLYS